MPMVDDGLYRQRGGVASAIKPAFDAANSMEEAAEHRC
jgi:hypothetical protein